MRIKVEIGPFRFEVAFEIAKRTPDTVPDDTIATGLGSDRAIHLPDGRGPRRSDCHRRMPWLR